MRPATVPVVILIGAMLAAPLRVASSARADMVDSSAVPPWEHCAQCHGLDGNSGMAKFPRLAGQRYVYMEKQLMDFRARRRTNDGGQMDGITHQFEPAALLDAAKYFSALPAPPPSAAPGPEAIATGRALFGAGKPSAEVPACANCHGAAARPALAVPRLDAQHARYLQKQLEDFRAGARANDPHSTMRRIASALSDDEIAAVTGYLASLARDAEGAP